MQAYTCIGNGEGHFAAAYIGPAAYHGNGKTGRQLFTGHLLVQGAAAFDLTGILSGEQLQRIFLEGNALFQLRDQQGSGLPL
ncbi:hypothetical protein D3C87_2064720 [compost metagenome]